MPGPSIGAIEFAFVSRTTEPPAEQVEEITRPHVDGMALRKIGVKGQPFRLVAMAGATDKDAAKTQVNSYKGLAGTVVDVVDDHDITWEKVAIMVVRIPRIKGVTSVVGPMVGATKIITVEFECRDTRVTP